MNDFDDEVMKSIDLHASIGCLFFGIWYLILLFFFFCYDSAWNGVLGKELVVEIVYTCQSLAILLCQFPVT